MIDADLIREMRCVSIHLDRLADRLETAGMSDLDRALRVLKHHAYVGMRFGGLCRAANVQDEIKLFQALEVHPNVCRRKGWYTWREPEASK